MPIGILPDIFIFVCIWTNLFTTQVDNLFTCESSEPLFIPQTLSRTHFELIYFVWVVCSAARISRRDLLSKDGDFCRSREFRQLWITPHHVIMLNQCNSSPPGQNGRHLTSDIFGCIFKNEKFCIFFIKKFHWCLFRRVQSTTSQHWFR